MSKIKVLLITMALMLIPQVTNADISLPASMPNRPAVRIIIETIGIDRDVEVAFVRNGTWDMRPFTENVAHLQGTGNVGEVGRAVLAGHSAIGRSPGPFSKLHILRKGDPIVLHANDGIVYTYVVDSKLVVSPSATEVIASTTDGAYLTLITCHGRERLVVNAILDQTRNTCTAARSISRSKIHEVKAMDGMKPRSSEMTTGTRP